MVIPTDRNPTETQRWEHREKINAKAVNIVSKDGLEVEDDNSLPTRDVDVAGRMAVNTVFGDRIVGQRIPTVASHFYYPLSSDRADFISANSGTLAYDNSMLKLRTAAQANSLSKVTGKFYLRYIPGHEAYCFFTAVYNTPIAGDSFQRMGLYDDDNGFFIGYEGDKFVVARRRAGVTETKEVDITKVFPDGTFNPQLGNVYKISFGFLGFATIHFEIMTPTGSWVLLETFEYPNTSIETHISTTYLPVRGEMFNGTSAEAMELASGSITSGIVDGAGTDPGSRRFSFESGTLTLASGRNTVATFRNKTTYGGKTNRVVTQLTLVTSACEGNKPVSVKVVKDITITNTPTWTNVNTADSIIEYSLNATSTPLTGTILFPFNMAKADSFFEQVEEQVILLRPGETASIISNSTGATEMLIAFRWKELF